MSLEDQKGVLHEIAKVRIPSMKVPDVPGDPDAKMAPREKIAELESYLLLTAEARQEGHLAKLIVQESLDELQAKWDGMEGWEMHLPSGNRTQAGIVEAKRQANPGLYSSIQTGKRLVDRLGEQIRRLEIDGDKVASRLYTMVTGG